MTLYRSEFYAPNGDVVVTVVDSDAHTITTFLNGTQQSTRALTPDEETMAAARVADETTQANQATIEADIDTFLAGLDTALANMDAIIASPQPSFVNLAQALTQVQAIATALKQVATTERNHLVKTARLARYASNKLDTLGSS